MLYDLWWLNLQFYFTSEFWKNDTHSGPNLPHCHEGNQPMLYSNWIAKLWCLTGHMYWMHFLFILYLQFRMGLWGFNSTISQSATVLLEALLKLARVLSLSMHSVNIQLDNQCLLSIFINIIGILSSVLYHSI